MSTSTQSALLAQETFEKEVIGEGQFCQVRRPAESRTAAARLREWFCR